MSDTPEQDTKVVAVQRFDTGSLRSISSFADAMRLAQATGEVVKASETIGDGFALLDNKRALLDIPFIALDWTFRDSDIRDSEGVPRQYVSITLVTGKGDKFIVNDGGTGLCEQLREFEREFGSHSRSLVAERGLRVSEYDYTDPHTGQVTPAETFYIA